MTMVRLSVRIPGPARILAGPALASGRSEQKITSDKKLQVRPSRPQATTSASEDATGSAA
jgi:hypothetical protein